MRRTAKCGIGSTFCCSRSSSALSRCGSRTGNTSARARDSSYGAFIVAFTILVIAGYLVPISWTGFGSQKLWNWIELLVLPAALAGTAALTGRGIRYQGRLLRPYERGMVIALVAGWIVTVIGGYALHWTWTGYSGNTLWDWLQMLLVPLVFPAILLPFLLKWISGNAAERAAMAHEAPVVPPARGGGRDNIRAEAQTDGGAENAEPEGRFEGQNGA